MFEIDKEKFRKHVKLQSELPDKYDIGSCEISGMDDDDTSEEFMERYFKGKGKKSDQGE